jgi:molecular chaperone IbpA
MNYISTPHDQFPPKKSKDELTWDIAKKQRNIETPASLIDAMFPNLDRWSIGFDPFFAALKAAAPATKVSSYPPYNVKKFDDGSWRIDLALAGWRKEEIDVTVKDRTLTISSNYDPTDEDIEEAKVVYQGISQRKFTTNFALAEHVEVEAAEMTDGILTIHLVTNIPDELKPKKIDIQ